MTLANEVADQIEEIREVQKAIDWLLSDCQFNELNDIPEMFEEEYLEYLENYAHESLSYGYYDDAISFIELLMGNTAYVEIEPDTSLWLELRILAQAMRNNHLMELEFRLRDLKNGIPESVFQDTSELEQLTAKLSATEAL